MQNTRFVNINDFDINKLNILPINSKSHNGYGQYTTFANYDQNSFVMVSDIYQCNWSPINMKSEIYLTDEQRSFFNLYETDELKNLFNYFREIDNKIMSTDEYYGDLINNKNAYTYLPIVKKQEKFDSKSQHNNFYDKDKIKINFKKSKNGELKTKLMEGIMINNKFVGEKNDQIKTVTELSKNFKYGCKFRMFMKIKKIWFHKLGRGLNNFSPVLECVRLDIIKQHNINILNEYDNFTINDCKNVTINGENKKIIEFGNGLFKVVDDNKIMNTNYNKIKVIRPTYYNLKESNNKIIQILKDS